jgi:5'-deoxynucleotidase YfbR-like HD superfamily hydrolase
MDGYIHTYTGKMFDPLNPDPELLDIRDIGHALSLQARFAGHTRDFYSVAEHSVRVSMACGRNDALAGLMHDAAEAYLTDLPKPVKRSMMEFQLAEENLLIEIAKKFNFPYPLPASVKRADLLLLNTEARDLLSGNVGWADKFNVQPGVIRPLSPRAAESWFAERYRALTRVKAVA